MVGTIQATRGDVVPNRTPHGKNVTARPGIPAARALAVAEVHTAPAPVYRASGGAEAVTDVGRSRDARRWKRRNMITAPLNTTTTHANKTYCIGPNRLPRHVSIDHFGV